MMFFGSITHDIAYILTTKYQTTKTIYYDCNINNFSDQVLSRRQKMDMSQTDLERATSISQSTIAQIESGRNKGSKHLLTLADGN